MCFHLKRKKKSLWKLVYIGFGVNIPVFQLIETIGYFIYQCSLDLVPSAVHCQSMQIPGIIYPPADFFVMVHFCRLLVQLFLVAPVFFAKIYVLVQFFYDLNYKFLISRRNNKAQVSLIAYSDLVNHTLFFFAFDNYIHLSSSHFHFFLELKSFHLRYYLRYCQAVLYSISYLV